MMNQKFGALEFLTCERIAVPHCFSTRLGGVSTGYLASLNLGTNRGDSMENVEKNYEILGKAVGFDPNKLVLNHQVHSDLVRVVTDADCRGLDNRDYPDADALITNTPGLALAAFTADCTPILLWDLTTGAVGAIHAGWRGTVADIAGKTVRAMQTAFGTRPEDLVAAIGPNIAQCCFETDRDVPDAVRAVLGAEAEGLILQNGEKYHVDLKGVNAALLRRAGVREIHISDECTACRSDRYWSHRVTRGQRGSQAAIICREEAK